MVKSSRSERNEALGYNMGKRTGEVEILHEDDCNEISQLIAGVDFEELSPDNRVKIADLVLKRSMAQDLYEMRRWFEESKLWDGL